MCRALFCLVFVGALGACGGAQQGAERSPVVRDYHLKGPCGDFSAKRGFILKKQATQGSLKIRHLVALNGGTALCPGDLLKAKDKHHLEVEAGEALSLRVYRVTKRATEELVAADLDAGEKLRIPAEGALEFSGSKSGESIVLVASRRALEQADPGLAAGAVAALAGERESGLLPAPEMSSDALFRSRGEIVVSADTPSVSASFDATGLAVVPLWVVAVDSVDRGVGMHD